MPNLVIIGPAVWPPILDRHTHTQNLYYIDIDEIWIESMAKHVGPTVKVNEHSEEKGSVDLIEIIYANG